MNLILVVVLGLKLMDTYLDHVNDMQQETSDISCQVEMRLNLTIPNYMT